MIDWLTWWFWRRWQIYCPPGDVSHLFKNDSLYDPEEKFEPPCLDGENMKPGIQMMATGRCKDT